MSSKSDTERAFLCSLCRLTLPAASFCATCNIGLGHFEDDPTRLRSAAAYLEG